MWSVICEGCKLSMVDSIATSSCRRGTTRGFGVLLIFFPWGWCGRTRIVSYLQGWTIEDKAVKMKSMKGMKPKTGSAMGRGVSVPHKPMRGHQKQKPSSTGLQFKVNG